MSTIPASDLVDVVPSVLGAGGDALDAIGLILTTSTRPPIGTVQSFGSADAVGDYFGSGSDEETLAGTYFQGFSKKTKVPGSVLFAQYPQTAVAAYARGGDVSALTLAELQAFNGAFAVTINGVVKSGSVNLSAATSFSNAALLIAEGLDIEGAQAASFTGAISTTTLTVSAVASGALAVGQFVVGAGVTAGTYITALGTGTGGTGTYTVSASQTVGSEAMTAQTPGVTYDSTSGGFVVASGTTGAASTINFPSGALATDLGLTEATGAVLSQGADATTPADFMDGIVAITTNWLSFMTAFDPDDPDENTVKEAFAAWKNTQGNRYVYVCWDTDVTPSQSVPAASSLGQILAANGDSGTCLVWNTAELAAFVCGAAASIDFNRRNGRITFAFKSGDVDATVTDQTVAQNLGGNPQTGNRGNNYNFYGAYAQANTNFVWFQRGFVTGDFLWLDSYVNQIWLNAQFQLALLTLMENSNSIPYSVSGAALIDNALADPIQAGLNFGAYAPGDITDAQAAAVNSSAGLDIADTLRTQGWYLQVGQASASSRAARTTPPCTFWYLDRGSVQAITLASVALQ